MSCETATAVCRTCLATDVKMWNLGSTKLQNIFEKLTDSKLGTFGGSVCYVCCSQLQRCQSFLNMALRAEQVFRQLQTKGIQLIPDSVTALRPTNSFISTPVVCMALPDAEGVVSVKIEPIDVKEESQAEDSSLYCAVKIEDATEDFLQDCEESYISDDCAYNQTWRQQIEINKKHISEDCGKSLKGEVLLKDHTDEHICNYCQFKCSDKLEFQRHLRKHTKPFHCNFCKKSFSEQSSLRKHKTSHSSKKPYICDYCSKGFGHKTYLITHLRTHTHEKPFKCVICFKQFAQTGHLISHKRTHYPKSGTSYIPEVKKQTHKSINIHKSHKCVVCGKCFAERNGLNRHMKTHTGLRPYSCEFCSKTFAARDTLSSHVRCHTGERPFRCVVCGRMFTARGNFNRHMKSHNTEQPTTEVV